MTQSGNPRRPALAAALLTGVLSACAVVSTTSTPGASPSLSPQPSGATTRPSVRPTASATGSPSTDQPAISTQFTVAHSFSTHQWVSEVIDVVHWQGRFVAVSLSQAIQSNATETIVWSSPDGHAWARISVVLADAPVRLQQLVAVGERKLMLIGGVMEVTGDETRERPAVWESTNLADWIPTELGVAPTRSGRPPALVHGRKGYVAAVGGAVWFAPDGVAWERSLDLSPSKLAAGDDGFIAVEPSGLDAARVLASGDGRSWHEGDSLPGGTISVASVAGGDWVLVGGQSDYGIWTSTDGLTWTRSTSIAELTGLTSGIGIHTQVHYTPLVTVGDDVYMTLAWNHCCAQLAGGRGVYRSNDGEKWSSLALGDAVIQAGATDGETIVLVGQRRRGAEGVLWVSD